MTSCRSPSSWRGRRRVEFAVGEDDGALVHDINSRRNRNNTGKGDYSISITSDGFQYRDIGGKIRFWASRRQLPRSIPPSHELRLPKFWQTELGARMRRELRALPADGQTKPIGTSVGKYAFGDFGRTLPVNDRRSPRRAVQQLEYHDLDRDDTKRVCYEVHNI